EDRVLVVLAGGEVLPQGIADPQPQRDGALLAALPPADPQGAGPLAELEVLAPQGDGLVDPDAGVHEGQDHGDVAEAAVAGDRAGQGALLLLVEPAGRGQDLGDGRGGADLGGDPLGLGPGQERAEGGEAAVDRGGLELLVVAEVGLVFAELLGEELGGGRPLVEAVLVPGGETEQVAAVAGDGQGRPLVLHQVVEEPGQGGGPGGRLGPVLGAAGTGSGHGALQG